MVCPCGVVRFVVCPCGVVRFVVCPHSVLLENGGQFLRQVVHLWYRDVRRLSGFHLLVRTGYLRLFLCDVKHPLTVVVGPECCLRMCDFCDSFVVVISY